MVNLGLFLLYYTHLQTFHCSVLAWLKITLLGVLKDTATLSKGALFPE